MGRFNPVPENWYLSLGVSFWPLELQLMLSKGGSLYFMCRWFTVVFFYVSVLTLYLPSIWGHICLCCCEIIFNHSDRLKLSLQSEICVMCAVTRLCLILCDPMDWSLPGSSVQGILQARILEWDAISFSRGSSWLRDRNCISYHSCIAFGFFTSEPVVKIF